jgi:hypothetical protein
MHVMRVYNMTLKNKFNPIIILNNLWSLQIATLQSVVNTFTHVTRSHKQDFNTLN